MSENPQPQPAAADSAAQPGNKGTATAKAKQIKKVIEVKCTDRVARLANLIAIGICAYGILIRILFNFGVVGGEASGFDLFLFLHTFYFGSFVFLLGAAEYGGENNYTRFALTYFNFLARRIGRGLFLIFLAMLLTMTTGSFEGLLAIIVVCIGIIDIILGWDETMEALPKLPWQQGGAPAEKKQESNDVEMHSKRRENEPASTGVIGNLNDMAGNIPGIVVDNFKQPEPQAPAQPVSAPP